MVHTAETNRDVESLRLEVAALMSVLSSKDADTASIHSVNSLMDKVALKSIILELQKIYRACLISFLPDISFVAPG